MSDLVEKQYRFLEVGELIKEGDEWTRNWNPEADDVDWSQLTNVDRRVPESSPNIYRRQVNIKHYRYLKVGERINPNTDQFYSKSVGMWRSTNCRLKQTLYGIKYRRPIESKPNEETDVSSSTDRGETSTDSSSNQSNRNRHITINKSDYCWDGSVDLTKQHCISVSVEEV